MIRGATGPTPEADPLAALLLVWVSLAWMQWRSRLALTRRAAS